MIDHTTIERYMRDANPVTDADAVDADELARSAAVTYARRAEFLHAPGLERSAIPFWRRAWALAAGFGVILLVVGAGALLLRADSAPIAEEQGPAGEPVIESLAVGWERVTDDPVAARIAKWCASPQAGPFPACVLSPLPGGGFYFVNFLDEAVAWSPDGFAWFYGPPQGLTMVLDDDVPEPPAVTVGDAAVVAGADDGTVWVGDPVSGSWDPIELDVSGLFDRRIVVMAASPSSVLVVGQGSSDGGAVETVAWIVDLGSRTSLRHQIAGDIPLGEAGDILAAWADGNWVVVPLRVSGDSDLLYSGDGSDWYSLELPGTGMASGNAEAEEPTIQSLVVGEPGIVAFGDLPDDVLESHNGLWFSANGVDWRIVRPVDAWPVALAYSSELGFVAATDGSDDTLTSADGVAWRETGVLPWAVEPEASERVLGASGTTLLAADASGLWRWTLEGAAAAPPAAATPPLEALQAPVWRSADGVTWIRSSDDAAFAGKDVRVFDVTSGGPGYVAVGSAAESAAVWTSADGLDWSRSPGYAATFGGAGVQHMEAITPGGPGFVSVGFTFDEPGKSGLWPAVWTSPDGLLWSRSAIEPSGEGWLHDVTAGGPGLVAVGIDGWTAAVWTSRDGMTWSRVPHDPEVFGFGASWESHTEMQAVTVGGPGLVAVGSDDGYSNAAVWTSRDGLTWSRVWHDDEIFGGVGGQGIADVVAAGPGLVAVGQDEPDVFSAVGGIRAAVWTSADGLAWTRVPHDSDLFGENEDERQMRRVVAAGSGLIAVGTDIWTSPDGVAWTWVPPDLAGFGDAPLAHAEAYSMSGVTSGPSGFVAVGSEL